MREGARGNAENRLEFRAPTAGLGRDFSATAGDECDGTSGKSATVLCIETGRLLGGCGGFDLDVEVDERESDRRGTGRGSSFWGVGGGMLSSDGDEETNEETELSRTNSGGSVGESDPLVEGGKAPSLVWNGLVRGEFSRLCQTFNQKVIRKCLVLVRNHETYTMSLVTVGADPTVSRLGSRSCAEADSPLFFDDN